MSPGRSIYSRPSSVPTSSFMVEKGRFSKITTNLLPGQDNDPDDDKAGPESGGTFRWSFHGEQCWV